MNSKEIEGLDPKISIIYRNYKAKINIKLLKEFKKTCDKQKREFYLANFIKVAIKLKLSGVYIPSFNKLLNLKQFNIRQKFKIIGSAHNISEIRIKEKQGCKEIFVSPLFKTKKLNFFNDVIRFNNITKDYKQKIIGLGGICEKNFSKLKLTNLIGFASIEWIKKNRPKKIGRFF